MIVVLTLQITQFRKAPSVQVSHSFSATSAVFDDEHLVSYAGLVPVMTLAEQTGLACDFSARRCSIAERPDQVSGGQPGAEAGHRGGRHVCGCGQLRRHRCCALWRDEDFVRRRVRALDGGNVVAGVHLRSRPPARIGATRALGGVERAGRSATRSRSAKRSSTSTRCCARSTGTPNRAPPTGIPRSPVNRFCARGSRRWRPRSAPRVRLR